MDKDTLHRFFAGTASREEERAVCDWAETSDEHRAELIRRRKQYDLLLFWGEDKGAKPERLHRKGWSAYLVATLKIAATIAALVASTVYLYDRSRATEPHPIAMNRLTVPPGQRVSLTLSDGTAVWLNACSELTYPADLTRGPRLVSLKGEAYFEVTKQDERHPFVVQTRQCDVKVLGTKFNVSTDEEDNTFEAALLEGSIELKEHAKEAIPIRLSPMQQANWSDGKLSVDSIRDLDNFRWREGLLCFDHITFADLMKRFEKIYDVRIEIQSDRLRNYRCSGKFRITDGVNFILQVLQQSVRFTFARNEDNTMIYIQ